MATVYHIYVMHSPEMRPFVLLIGGFAGLLLVLGVAAALLGGLDAVVARVASAVEAATTSPGAPVGLNPPTNATAGDADNAAYQALTAAQETMLVVYVLVVVALVGWEAAVQARRHVAAAVGGHAAAVELEMQPLVGGATSTGAGKEGAAAASGTAAAAVDAAPAPSGGGSVAEAKGHDDDETYKALKAFAVILSVVILMLIVDGPFPWHSIVSADKRPYSRDVFVFMCLTVATMGAITLRRTHANDNKPLQREQTDEWRGFMQIGFVLYHYFKAKEVYNVIRLFIAAYVFLTGFGNFSFFWVKRDFSFLRVCKMLLRLNLLVFIMCVTLNKPWMLYYVCPLHTFNFFIVYAAMGIMPHKNTEPMWMIGKFACVFFFLAFLFEVPGIFNGIFTLLWPLVQFEGNLHEWHFRATLDHYAVLWGMILAYNFPALEKALYALELPGMRLPSSSSSSSTAALIEGENDRFSSNTIAKIVIGVVAFVGVFGWVYFFFNMNKYEYNSIHPYVSFVPLVGYVVLRNINKTSRSYVMGIFQWSGRITLETYLLQFHVPIIIIIIESLLFQTFYFPFPGLADGRRQGPRAVYQRERVLLCQLFYCLGDLRAPEQLGL